MQSTIELKHNVLSFCSHDEHIHFNHIGEVDVYLRSQHYTRFTEGVFSVVRCRIDQEESIQSLIDAYENRAAAIERTCDSWTEAQKDLQASKDWLTFYHAIKTDHPDVVSQRDRHIDVVSDLTERVEMLKIEYNQLKG